MSSDNLYLEVYKCSVVLLTGKHLFSVSFAQVGSGVLPTYFSFSLILFEVLGVMK